MQATSTRLKHETQSAKCCDFCLNITIWTVRNSIKKYQAKNVVHLLIPYKTEETFGTT